MQVKGPLEGVRILDFTRATSGPYGSLLLADLGAEVIKVEPLETPTRTSIGVISDYAAEKYDFRIRGVATHFLSLERDTKSIALDFHSEKGREVIRELARKVDVVFDNFRAGTPKKMGIDYDTLSKVNPRIITCSLTGYGATGPLSDRGGYDPIAQAMGGGVSITLAPDGTPVKPGISFGDNCGGMFAVIGILAALRGRDITGRGQQVDTSLLAGQISLLHYVVCDYFASGVSWSPGGTGGRMDPIRYQYTCKGGEYIVTVPIRAAVRGAEFETYAKAIGREDLLADPRFNDIQKRYENRHELVAELNKTYATKTFEEWDAILSAAGIPCSRINSIGQAVANPQVIHDEMVQTYAHPLGGDFKCTGNPIKMRGYEMKHIPPPLHGEHTVEILTTLLGYSEEKAAELKKEGIVTYP